ncbi:MAG: NADH-quinone oxidoreductase subunit A [bacterium]
MTRELLIEWLPVFILTGIATVFITLNVLLSKLLGEDNPLFSKLSPYESGNEPVGAAQQNVSIHYGLVAVLFILFDIEIIFLYPWIMTLVNGEYLMVGFSSIGVFVGLLAVGYFYAWKQGVFEWR